ncbi:ras-specific guanine nucleotide-releasing factor RalGPS1, variant [Capsaspora owczarzaki ATCC 30864]|uniref:Ras-specific guanine nucleotide-releasing factor RalGPS1, variant n=1 Tax=Capsaspora owczarzaki (strain ATCC 30864) TaxID=595528 RepID=A0A0D2X0L5_CAPO3|nr:ras-specific guanine nucleotide-releasing factor RalGPS1, variant [Capsaspora owczarzaki ATCC 30864]
MRRPGKKKSPSSSGVGDVLRSDDEQEADEALNAGDDNAAEDFRLKHNTQQQQHHGSSSSSSSDPHHPNHLQYHPQYQQQQQQQGEHQHHQHLHHPHSRSDPANPVIEDTVRVGSGVPLSQWSALRHQQQQQQHALHHGLQSEQQQQGQQQHHGSIFSLLKSAGRASSQKPASFSSASAASAHPVQLVTAHRSALSETGVRAGSGGAGGGPLQDDDFDSDDESSSSDTDAHTDLGRSHRPAPLESQAQPPSQLDAAVAAAAAAAAAATTTATATTAVGSASSISDNGGFSFPGASAARRAAWARRGKQSTTLPAKTDRNALAAAFAPSNFFTLPSQQQHHHGGSASSMSTPTSPGHASGVPSTDEDVAYSSMRRKGSSSFKRFFGSVGSETGPVSLPGSASLQRPHPYDLEPASSRSSSSFDRQDSSSSTGSGHQLPFRAVVEDFGIAELAKQWTIIDMGLFCKIGHEELLSCAWTKKTKLTLTPNIVAFTQRFNNVIYWMSQAVLTPSHEKDRAELVSLFIKLAKHLLKLNNINGVQAVVSMLQSTPIFRLSKTWALVSKKRRARFEKLADLMAEDSNRVKLREYTANLHLPCIPYLGLFLNDITYVDSAFPDPASPERMSKMMDIIDQVTKYQMSNYGHIPIVIPVREYLLSIQYLDELRTFIEDDNYKLSLEREPKASLAPTPVPPGHDTLSPSFPPGLSLSRSTGHLPVHTPPSSGTHTPLSQRLSGGSLRRKPRTLVSQDSLPARLSDAEAFESTSLDSKGSQSLRNSSNRTPNLLDDSFDATAADAVSYSTGGSSSDITGDASSAVSHSSLPHMPDGPHGAAGTLPHSTVSSTTLSSHGDSHQHGSTSDNSTVFEGALKVKHCYYRGKKAKARSWKRVWAVLHRSGHLHLFAEKRPSRNDRSGVSCQTAHFVQTNRLEVFFCFFLSTDLFLFCDDA